MSHLIYDHVRKVLSLLDRDGSEVGAWHANNNVDLRVGLSSLPNGFYSITTEDRTKPHRHPGSTHAGLVDDSTEGKFGPAGIIRLDDFKVNGTPHSGVGIHSGRKKILDKAGRKGVDHATELCIRTTDVAMSMISMTIRQDPLEALIVRNSAVKGTFVRTARTFHGIPFGKRPGKTAL